MSNTEATGVPKAEGERGLTPEVLDAPGAAVEDVAWCALPPQAPSPSTSTTTPMVRRFRVAMFLASRPLPPRTL